jgi:hypothetical protein
MQAKNASRITFFSLFKKLAADQGLTRSRQILSGLQKAGRLPAGLFIAQTSWSARDIVALDRAGCHCERRTIAARLG